MRRSVRCEMKGRPFLGSALEGQSRRVLLRAAKLLSFQAIPFRAASPLVSHLSQCLREAWKGPPRSFLLVFRKLGEFIQSIGVPPDQHAKSIAGDVGPLPPERETQVAGAAGPQPRADGGQGKPCWTPFPISTIIVSRTGCRTMDVGSWLRGLGLGQYEANFRDNKIDADVLPQLTADDLKDIGVSAVGDRRRLLAAIAALTGPTPSVNAPPSPPKPTPAGGLQISAERRPITILFCDLAGSTSLAEKLDAEDWRSLVNAYLDQASAAVTDFGGHVLKKLGDGLMALFGYPLAQENDAERAVRAALAIQRALADLNARNASSGAPELSARIGIETGPVVVDATGEVFGEAPNIAARVQAAADPGSVLVTGSVQRQVAGLFVVEEKGAHDLKDVAQPLSLYRSCSRQRRRPKRACGR